MGKNGLNPVLQVVTDWDDMESVWSHLYTKELSIPAEDHPLLLTETPINPRKNRCLLNRFL